MSAPRTLSLSGLLVALACSLAACGSSSSDSTAIGTSVPSTQAAQATSPAASSPTDDLTANDPPACNFFTPAEVAKKLLPTVKVAYGVPTSCTYTAVKGQPTHSIGFLYLSKGLIESTIASSKDKKQTVRSAWNIVLKKGKKEPGYAPLTGLGDSGYIQRTPGTLTIRWFVKDHAFYLHYNYDTKVPSQKNEVTLKDLIAFGKAIPDPSKVSTKVTAETDAS